MTDADAKEREKMGLRIRQARTMAGLSQGQVAKLLKLHRPSVSEIEAGNRRVTADELHRMATVFDVSVNWLLGKAPESISPEDPKVQLAARELKKLKPENLDRLLRILAAMRDDEGNSK